MSGLADTTVGLVGLGLMGAAMTERWLAAGATVQGYDVDPDRCVEHTARGGRVADSAATVAYAVDVVVLSLPDSTVGRSVCLGPGGVAEGAHAGLVVVDTTTGRPADAVELAAELGRRDVRYVDASLSGSSDMVRQGDILAMLGGEPADVERVRRVLEPIARASHHVGAAGAGMRTKLVVNLVLGAHRLALAEGLVLAEKAGMDLSMVLDVLRESAAYSRAMDIFGERMVAADHHPPNSRLRQYHKDVRLMLEQGQEVEAPLFVTSLVAQVLQAGVAGGLGDADNSAIVEVLRRLGGIGRIDG